MLVYTSKIKFKLNKVQKAFIRKTINVFQWYYLTPQGSSGGTIHCFCRVLISDSQHVLPVIRYSLISKETSMKTKRFEANGICTEINMTQSHPHLSPLVGDIKILYRFQVVEQKNNISVLKLTKTHNSIKIEEVMIFVSPMLYIHYFFCKIISRTAELWSRHQFLS